MIAFKSFLNPMSMLFNDKQAGLSKQVPKGFESSFEKAFNNTVKEKAVEPTQRDKRAVKYDERHKTKIKYQDKTQVETQKTTNNEKQDSSVKDNRVVIEESTAKNDHTKKDKIDDLSDNDKAIVKEMADKLNLNTETLINLMQSLNVDLKSLLQSSSNLDQALQKITIDIENAVAKLSIGQSLNGIDDIKSKIQLLIKDEKNISVNLKANDEISKSQLDVKMPDDSHNKALKVEIQLSGEANVQNKDKNVATYSHVNIDVNQEFDKKVISQGLEKDSGEMDSNQQTPQDASKGTPKNNDKIDMQSILSNVKVVDLKTGQKEGQSTDNLKVELQNTLPMQILEGMPNRVTPLNQTIKGINISKDNVFSQIVENAKLTLSDNQTEMEMNLKPESLGKLSIKIASENGLIMAKIITESEQVKSIIESNLSQFKEQLQQQGLKVQDFSVSVGQDQKQQLFSNQNSGSRNTKTQRISINSVVANESYVNRIMVNNPYLMSDSSIDYTA